MQTEQEEVIRFLQRRARLAGFDSELVETHGAYVVLAGNEALKLKRSVRYPYLDFSTLARREAMLRRELEINGTTAPQIYRDVVPVTRGAAGELALAGEGETVEWILRMWRFPAEAELDAIAARGGLTDELADELGRVLSIWHARAEHRSDDGARLMRSVLRKLDMSLKGMEHEIGGDLLASYRKRVETELSAIAPILSDRSRNGRVRRCHGDLHLRNVVLIDGKPLPFDALEFDEQLATCDVLYDLAFLLMDLARRDLARAANIVLNSYLLAVKGTEDSGLCVLPLFLAVRAAIRAMVEVQTDRARSSAGPANPQGRKHIEQALAWLSPPRACLLAIGGLSGTGKTTLARQIAPEFGATPGAVHLRSDLERKAMHGVRPTARLPPESYTRETSERIYCRLFERAEALIGAGRSVILDAAFLAESERHAAERLARSLNASFVGLWLEADRETLMVRVQARKDDASDADADVVAKQLESDFGEVVWIRLDARAGPQDAVLAAMSAIPE